MDEYCSMKNCVKNHIGTLLGSLDALAIAHVADFS